MRAWAAVSRISGKLIIDALGITAAGYQLLDIIAQQRRLAQEGVGVDIIQKIGRINLRQRNICYCAQIRNGDIFILLNQINISAFAQPA